MQIVQDVTPPEFGRLLGKKLVLSLPYFDQIDLSLQGLQSHLTRKEPILRKNESTSWFDFLVACTRLYNPLCPSVCLSVCRSVTLSFFWRLRAVWGLLLLPNRLVGQFHHCLCPPARDFGSCIRPCFPPSPSSPSVLSRNLLIHSKLPPKISMNFPEN